MKNKLGLQEGEAEKPIAGSMPVNMDGNHAAMKVDDHALGPTPIASPLLSASVRSPLLNPKENARGFQMQSVASLGAEQSGRDRISSSPVTPLWSAAQGKSGVQEWNLKSNAVNFTCFS